MRARSLALAVILAVGALAPRVRADAPAASVAPAPPGAAADVAAPDAQEPKLTPAQQLAEKHYKRARELYQLGRYREAIAQLEAALRSDPNGAELLYNLGLVHEKLGDADEAIAAYRHYLQVLGNDADPEEVAKVQAIIKRLDGAKTELKAREAKKTEHRFTPLSGGLLVGSGVALLSTALLGWAALRHDAEARDLVISEGRGLAERAALVERAKSEATLANVFGVITLLSAGTALTLYFTSEFPKKDDPNEIPMRAAIKVAPVAKGGSFQFEVTF
jgi:tetratricopeptide (TPR) repeat protein